MNLWEKISFFASNSHPFFCVIDFEGKKGDVVLIENLSDDFLFSIDNESSSGKTIEMRKLPINFDEYETKINFIKEQIKSGNTYLANLTQRTKIETKSTLREIYDASCAKFKLFYKDKFVCFSPERFVKIENDKIFTYPMKGTIDAKLPNAKELILENQKEMAEHTMVVDLLRNDLSIVSTNVRVSRFRYVDEIKAGEKNLLQVSSEICGDLHPQWQNNLGEILKALLPAGSISGTPKKKSLEIIKEIEGYDREFFTGIFGFFDGKNFDSGVMIRFIQKDGDDLYYKSGGGITLDSDNLSEYQEMLDKVYIPV